MSLAVLRDHLRSSLWGPPAVGVALALAGGFGLVQLDEALGSNAAGFSGGPDAARSVLSTIAAATITLAGLVFSITIVALQLASSQFSPRVMRTFLRDRASKLALAAFVSTFAFAFVLLRAVREDFVPGVAINVAIVLALVSVAMFVNYINHISHTLRIASIVDAVGRETRSVIERVHPPGDPPPAPALGEARRTIANGDDPGVLVAVRGDTLARTGEEHDCVLAVVPPIGRFVPGGAPLVEVHGPGDVDDDEVRGCLQLARERTMTQDVGFGLRQLVDVAEKALSPSINDPTTATQALDQVHDALRRLAARPLAAGRFTGPGGEVRALVTHPSWEQYVALAFDEVRQYGAGSLQFARHLRQVLTDLLAVAPTERAAPLCRQLELLDAAIEREVPDAADRAALRCV